MKEKQSLDDTRAALVDGPNIPNVDNNGKLVFVKGVIKTQEVTE